MRSKSRLTSSAVRRSVPLNTMCSRKWLTPISSRGSSRAPVFTKKPTAAVCESGLVSAITVKPFSRTVCRNSKAIRCHSRASLPAPTPLQAYLAPRTVAMWVVLRHSRQHRPNNSSVCPVEPLNKCDFKRRLSTWTIHAIAHMSTTTTLSWNQLSVEIWIGATI